MKEIFSSKGPVSHELTMEKSHLNIEQKNGIELIPRTVKATRKEGMKIAHKCMKSVLCPILAVFMDGKIQTEIQTGYVSYTNVLSMTLDKELHRVNCRSLKCPGWLLVLTQSIAAVVVSVSLDKLKWLATAVLCNLDLAYIV